MRHLHRCIELATEALNAGDAPFGSVLIAADGKVLAENRNRVASVDQTRHPEFELARWAAPVQPSEADLRAVLKAPRESARDDEQSLLDAVSPELNQRCGQQGSKDGGQDLPMVGFIRHVDHAPAKKSALTVILEALGAFCEKTLARFKALRRVSDEQAEKAALRR